MCSCAVVSWSYGISFTFTANVCALVVQLVSFTTNEYISAVAEKQRQQQSMEMSPVADEVATSSSQSMQTQRASCSPVSTTCSSCITESRTQWHCNSNLCIINEDSALAVNEMSQQIISSGSVNCLQLYLNINSCANTRKNPDKLGHSLSCTKQNGCNSLLKHAWLVACHFSGLRPLIQHLYKLRRISLCVRAVQQARCSGDFTLLRDAIEALREARDAATNGKEEESKKNTNANSQPTSCAVNEADSRFGKHLRQVASDRDSYVTTACDLREQLKPNLKPYNPYKTGKDSIQKRRKMPLTSYTSIKHNMRTLRNFWTIPTSAPTAHRNSWETKMSVAVCSTN